MHANLKLPPLIRLWLLPVEARFLALATLLSCANLAFADAFCTGPAAHDSSTAIFGTTLSGPLTDAASAPGANCATVALTNLALDANGTSLELTEAGVLAGVPPGSSNDAGQMLFCAESDPFSLTELAVDCAIPDLVKPVPTMESPPSDPGTQIAAPIPLSEQNTSTMATDAGGAEDGNSGASGQSAVTATPEPPYLGPVALGLLIFGFFIRLRFAKPWG